MYVQVSYIYIYIHNVIVRTGVIVCVQMYVHMCIKQEASNRFGSRHTSRYTRCAIGEDCPNETMIRETLVGWSTGVKGPKLFRMTVHLKMTYHGITYEMYECV